MIDDKGNIHDTKGRFSSKGDNHPAMLPSVTDEISANRAACIEYAKRRNIDLIWKAANIEVPGLTFPETKDIFEGIIPEQDPVGARKAIVVNNIKHAWQYLLDHADDPVDWQYISDYNRICGQYIETSPGEMRRSSVKISHSTYRPRSAITMADVFEDLSPALGETDSVRKSTHLFAVACRSQWFNNGNKRTATMAANHSIIHDGGGVFALPPQRMDSEFRDELIHYYETNDLPRFMDWLEYHAIGRLEDEGMTEAQKDGIDV